MTVLRRSEGEALISREQCRLAIPLKLAAVRYSRGRTYTDWHLPLPKLA